MRAYHARTKHRFDAYAEGPGQLDWDAQPAAFRHYQGAPAYPPPFDYFPDHCMKLQIVPARRGIHWVKAGVKTFFRQPLALSGLFFMFL